MNWRVLTENIRLAFGALHSQPLRTVFTLLIIAFGITALVGILTSTSAIESTIAGSFSKLGATTYTIQNRSSEIRVGRGGQNIQIYPEISFLEAINFKEKMGPEVQVAVSFSATSSAEIAHRDKKTNPNISVMAIDDNYLYVNGYDLEAGRNITKREYEDASSVCVIGPEVAEKLFKNEIVLGKTLLVRKKAFTIIGVLASRGSSFDFSGDRSVMIPLRAATALYPQSRGRTHALNVRAPNTEIMELSIPEAVGWMRVVRKLRPRDQNNFSIIRSDNLSNSLIEQLSFVKQAATGIGLITLLGAAVALMNIMLVSVTERTREIGVRKALGATPNTIRTQFLTEAITLGLTGGVFGVILGVAIGNFVSFQIGNTFIMPWDWVALGLFLCFLTAVISGYYPAAKASKLDPVEALRYE
ncbi:MAG: ABC transporter permease [Cryomorphaceae bacterium]|nr:ABC transporter permease [Cryomorphaceae bacterium]